MLPLVALIGVHLRVTIPWQTFCRPSPAEPAETPWSLRDAVLFERPSGNGQWSDCADAQFTMGGVPMAGRVASLDAGIVVGFDTGLFVCHVGQPAVGVDLSVE